jgi:hypothetical protein
MKTRRIQSDNPKGDQWKLLSQFSYPTNIGRYAASAALSPLPETVDYIAGCIRQSEAYFKASQESPIDISPLLLYYGTTNLLAGISALLTGSNLPIVHHGMRLTPPSAAGAGIGEWEINPIRPTDGALQQFANIFSSGTLLANNGRWTLKEVFGSIPDLIPWFETSYEKALPNCLPVKTIRGEMHGLSYFYDQIDMSILTKYGEVSNTLGSIHNLSNAYLPPRINTPAPFAKLFFKEEYIDPGIYSPFGQKYLPLVHVKGSQKLCPSQLLYFFMASFALGYLSRYHPEIWNPFVRNDETGERLVVEKFLSVCQRYFPNLVLNVIEKCRIQFVYEIEFDPSQSSDH